MRVTKRILALVLCLCLCAAMLTAYAAAPKLEFKVSAPDSQGFFTVDVTLYDAAFDAFGYSFNFNPSTVTPASWADGSATMEFSEFAKASQTVSEGMYDGYVPKGKGLVSSIGIFADIVTAPSSGTLLFSYRFKQTSAGDTGIMLAVAGSGREYNPNSPDGYEVFSGNDILDVACQFILPSGSVVTPPVGTTPTTPQPTDGTVVVTPDKGYTKADREKNTTIMQIGNYAAARDGVLCHIYPGEKMITPYIQGDESGNGRTMVPVRFVAESFNATVDWDNVGRTVSIRMGDTLVRMTIGIKGYTINNVGYSMDAAAEIMTYGDGSGDGRTMVPIRFVAEALGKDVYWDNDNRLVIVTEPTDPWQPERGAEIALTQDVLLIISPLVRDFIG